MICFRLIFSRFEEQCKTTTVLSVHVKHSFIVGVCSTVHSKMMSSKTNQVFLFNLLCHLRVCLPVHVRSQKSNSQSMVRFKALRQGAK